MNRFIAAAVLALPLLSACTPMYPGPRTSAHSGMTIRATGLQTHAAVPNDKLLVRVFLGSDVKGTELGMIRLSTDEPTGEIRLDQGVEYTIWVTSIESHFGGFSSCGFYVPITPVKDESYRVDYRTRKNDCTVLVTRVDRDQRVSKVLEGQNIAGGTNFSAQITRF